MDDRFTHQEGTQYWHGISLVWRFCVPLIIDLCPVGLAWVLVPARFQTPMETIALFAPDAFLVVATVTALSLGWAMARTLLTLDPRRVMNDANSFSSVRRSDQLRSVLTPDTRRRRL